MANQNLLSAVIPGPPVGKARPRVVFRGGRAIAYTPAKTADWETFAVKALRDTYNGKALDGPLKLIVHAVAPRPQRLLRKSSESGRILRMTKPDGDNVLKCCGDALKKAGWVRDDAHIADWTCVCYYAALDEPAHVWIQLAMIQIET